MKIKSDDMQKVFTIIEHYEAKIDKDFKIPLNDYIQSSENTIE